MGWAILVFGWATAQAKQGGLWVQWMVLTAEPA